MNKLLPALLAATTLIPAAGIAAAPARGGVTITTGLLREQRVAAADGSTAVRLVAPTRITPGDHLVYRISYRNGGQQPASGVVIANPVPAHLLYAGPAANSPAADLSVDGRTFGPLATLSVPTAGGGKRPAEAADVRVVRWRLAQPLAPGGEGQVGFRALLK